MKTTHFSTNRRFIWGSRIKITLWSLFFLLNFFLWYHRFFSLWASITLSLILAVEVGGMLCVGYFRLARRKKFPRLEFWSWVLFFSLFRFLIVYYVLQHKVPIDTVFSHPERAIYFIIGSSAAFVFFGYSYSIYEWGLAAREKFLIQKTSRGKEIRHALRIRSAGKNVHLLPDDVLYLEAKGEYVNYVCKHGNYMCFQRMKQAEKDLREYGFIRIHRSYIINPVHLVKNNNSVVQLSNDLELPVSKSYRAILEAYFNEQEGH